MTGNGEHNIRYIGFESLSDARRRLEYAITAKGVPTRRASVEIPGSAFSGPNRVTFQESAAIGYEKVRREVSDRHLSGWTTRFCPHLCGYRHLPSSTTSRDKRDKKA
jgi:hypothetical protein